MVALLAIVAAIALHHSGIATGTMHDDHGMSAAIGMCLAVMTVVGAAVMVIALGVLTLGRRRAARPLMPVALVLAARQPARWARAGPPLLCLLCISRR